MKVGYQHNDVTLALYADTANVFLPMVTVRRVHNKIIKGSYNYVTR